MSALKRVIENTGKLRTATREELADFVQDTETASTSLACGVQAIGDLLVTMDGEVSNDVAFGIGFLLTELGGGLLGLSNARTYAEDELSSRQHQAKESVSGRVKA
jgi:hypothetical protein